MAYICPACGERANLSACENCHGTGISLSVSAQLAAKDAEIAALGAEGARKDEALNELHQLAALRHDPASGKIIEAALAPSDAGKKWAAMARVCEDARWIRANADIRPHSTRGAGAAGNGMTRLEVFQERLDSLDAALRELEK